MTGFGVGVNGPRVVTVKPGEPRPELGAFVLVRDSDVNRAIVEREGWISTDPEKGMFGRVWTPCVKAGATFVCERFPGSVAGQAVSLYDFLRVGVEWRQAVETFTRRDARTGRKNAYVCYLADPRTLNGDGWAFELVLQILEMIGATAVFEGVADGPVEAWSIDIARRRGLLFAREPWWDAGATGSWKDPVIVEENLLDRFAMKRDGTGWVKSWRPFSTGPELPRRFLIGRDEPNTAAWMQDCRDHGWVPVVREHRLRAGIVDVEEVRA